MNMRAIRITVLMLLLIALAYAIPGRPDIGWANQSMQQSEQPADEPAQVPVPEPPADAPPDQPADAAPAQTPDAVDEPQPVDAPADAAQPAPAEGQQPPASPPATGATAGGTAAPAGQATAADFGIASGSNIAVIRIEGMIYGFTLESLERRVDRAMAAGASLIVLELDTPGGVLTDALDIAKYIKAEIPVPTIAWVNNQAYSAGILIASAADYIIMSPASSTGDCAPIVPGQNLPPTERAKALSPLLAEFKDNARANNYDYVLFHAMCVLGIEVWQIENPQTGEQQLVNQADYRVMVLGESLSDVRASSNLPVGGGSTAGSSPLQPGTQPTSTPAPADYEGVSPTVATDADRGQWQLVGQVHDGRTLLTVNQNEAMDIGLSKAIVRTDAELVQMLSAASVIRVPQSWSENLAGFLVNPIVRGVLVVAFLVCAYIEFQAPGLGLPGAVALAALILLLGAPFIVGLAEIWHLLLFAFGFLLLLAELFITPGFGVLGVSGIVCMFVGLVLQAVPSSGGFQMPPPEMWGRLQQTVLWTLLSLIASMVGVYFVTKHFGRIPGVNRLVLADAQMAGVTADGVLVTQPTAGGDAYAAVTVGDSGRCITDLRPAGRMEIDDRIVDVVSDSGWIEAGRRVRVIEVRGNRVVVEQV